MVLFFKNIFKKKNLKAKYEKELNVDAESDKLFKQIEIFEKHARDNFQEMDSQMENIEGVWDDLKTCFEYVYNTIQGTQAEVCLLSMFQHFLLIRDDSQVRNSYYRLIEECCVKIILHKDGRDPDFEYGSKFDLDVESLISMKLFLEFKFDENKFN